MKVGTTIIADDDPAQIKAIRELGFKYFTIKHKNEFISNKTKDYFDENDEAKKLTIHT